MARAPARARALANPTSRSRARPTVAALALLLVVPACATRPDLAEDGPQRRIPLDNTLNTRDLGGYRTEDGRQVRWGLVYRSDQLSRLDDDDVETLAALDLKVVYDLRTDEEREGEEDRLPEGVQLEQLTMSHPSMDPRVITRRILRGDAPPGYFEKMVARANRTFALEHGRELATLVRALSNPDGMPALFHCTYGKDRTGFAAAMVLTLVGVPWETVVDDYLLSNEYLESNIRSMSRLIWFASLFRISRDDARALLGVDRDYIESARQAIFDSYGSIEAYHAAIGLDPETVQRLREVMLEPAPITDDGDE